MHCTVDKTLKRNNWIKCQYFLKHKYLKDQNIKKAVSFLEYLTSIIAYLHSYIKYLRNKKLFNTFPALKKINNPTLVKQLEFFLLKFELPLYNK